MVDVSIVSGGLRHFVVDILKKRQEEKEHESHWQMWLHHYYAGSEGKMSFGDYMNKVKSSAKESGKTIQKNRAKLDEGISKSYEILKGFKPS